MTDIDIHDEPDNADVSRLLLSRRRLLALGGAGLAGAGLVAAGTGTVFAGTAGATTAGAAVPASEAAAACGLTTEQMEGPYYIDGMLRRRNIVEDRTGVPLALTLRVIDAATCRPLHGAAVEIWHCDALGIYSGYTAVGSGGGMPPFGTPSPGGPSAPPSGPPAGGPPQLPPTDDLTFLRGLQVSDRHGYVTFRSVVPGWYTRRAVHIHTKVHTDGRATATGYTGGRTSHTGQLYFEEALVNQLTTLSPYRTNKVVLTTLEQDFIYPGGGSTGGLLALRYNRSDLSAGVAARLTISVDARPRATATPA